MAFKKFNSTFSESVMTLGKLFQLKLRVLKVIYSFYLRMQTTV